MAGTIEIQRNLEIGDKESKVIEYSDFSKDNLDKSKPKPL
jgi:hypothetical protein